MGKISLPFVVMIFTFFVWDLDWKIEPVIIATIDAIASNMIGTINFFFRYHGLLNNSIK